MGGQVTVALGIGLYFLCLFKAPCHWSISPNRGGTFLRENSNGIKVCHKVCHKVFDTVTMNMDPDSRTLFPPAGSRKYCYPSDRLLVRLELLV